MGRLRQQMLLQDLGIELVPPVKTRDELIKTRDELERRNQKAASGEKLHHSVYVILLDPAVLQDGSKRVKKVLRSNPDRDPAKPCVYVGMTGLAVQDRFQNHKAGRKAAWVVKNYGVGLMPELYEYLNPMPYKVAAQMVKCLAENLRAEGYTVACGSSE
jgi:hypothetical protein